MAGKLDWLRSFSQKPLGFGLFMALIVVLVALGLFGLGLILGAIVLILLGFGVPVYLGWKKSFKTLFLVAIILVIAVPPVYAAFYNNELFQQYNVPSSSDNILQSASVHPFSYPPAKGNTYDFSISTVSQNESGNFTKTTDIILWVTDCPNDGFGSTNLCGENPDYFHSFPYFINQTTNGTRSVNWAFWNLTLPSNKIFYFQFTANYTLGTYYGYSAIGYCTFSKGVCTPAAQESSYWYEGPITGSWAAIYVTLLPDIYLLMGVLGALLAVIIVTYRYLKIREKRRQDEAKAAASGAPTLNEASCSSCGAVMKKDETTCWKCGKLQSAPSQDLSLK